MPWNRDLVEMVFWPPTAKAIFHIPLSLVGRDYELFWLAATDGMYTTKIGMNSFVSIKRRGTTSSSTDQQLSKRFWKALWLADCLPRCKEVAWRAVKGILLVWQVFRVRGIDVEDVCTFYSEQPETICHVLFMCSIVSRWWFAFLGSIRVWDGSTVLSILETLLLQGDPSVAGACLSFLYVVWKAHNWLVFQGKMHWLRSSFLRLVC